MDTIAEELGIDPMQLRLKNAIQKGDKDPANGLEIKSCGIRGCVEEVAKAIGWKKRHRGTDQGPRRKGLGVAWMINTSGAARIMDETCSAEVKICADGK